jgi:hypothetical protein
MLIIVMMLALSVVSCGYMLGKGAVRPDSDTNINVNMEGIKTLSVVVEKKEEKLEISEDDIKLFKSILTDKLHESGWKIVENASDGIIIITVTDYAGISQFTRLMAGFFAPRAKIKADVRIKNGNRIIANFSIEGQSAAAGNLWTKRGTTKEAMEMAAETLAGYLKSGSKSSERLNF